MLDNLFGRFQLCNKLGKATEVPLEFFGRLHVKRREIAVGKILEKNTIGLKKNSSHFLKKNTPPFVSNLIRFGLPPYNIAHK